MSITGEPGRGPMRVGIPIADLCTGLFCALGILTALLERDKSGEGQWLHSSLLQSQLFMLDFQAARWLMAQEVAPQVGNDHPTNLPTGFFEEFLLDQGIQSVPITLPSVVVRKVRIGNPLFTVQFAGKAAKNIIACGANIDCAVAGLE